MKATAHLLIRGGTVVDGTDQLRRGFRALPPCRPADRDTLVHLMEGVDRKTLHITESHSGSVLRCPMPVAGCTPYSHL